MEKSQRRIGLTEMDWIGLEHRSAYIFMMRKTESE